MTLTEDEELMLEQARTQLDRADLQNQQLQNVNQSQSNFMEDKEKGMAEEQLDVSKELAKIQHLLQGDTIALDANGVEYWESANENDKIFNEHGVRSIMQVLNIYVTKVKLLANYNEEEIRFKMLKFSNEIADYIFLNTTEFGMNTSNKRKSYSIIVIAIKDMVHDIYSRAMGGKERDSIRKHWNLNENVGTPMMNRQQQKQNGIRGFYQNLR